MVRAPRDGQAAPASGATVPWDVMVDDVYATRTAFSDQGKTVTEVEKGKIHDSFYLTLPDGQLLQVTSSHAGDRPV